MHAKKTNLYLLTGFYGSGKTTALMRILDQVEGQRVGVIQSEHGTQGQTIEINEDATQTSLSCSCPQDRLVQALELLSERQLDDLFVESVGLSDLFELENKMNQSATLLAKSYELRGVICLIDANHFMEQKNIETVMRQLQHSHLAVINKADLVSPELLAAICQQVKRINPNCESVSCSFGGFRLELLQNGLPPLPKGQEAQPDLPVPMSPLPFVLNCRHPVPKAAFEAFLGSVKADSYRIKGFFELDEGWFQVEGISAQVELIPCTAKEFSQLRIISRVGKALGEQICANWNKLVGLDAKIMLN